MSTPSGYRQQRFEEMPHGSIVSVTSLAWAMGDTAYELRCYDKNGTNLDRPEFRAVVYQNGEWVYSPYGIKPSRTWKQTGYVIDSGGMSK